MNSSHSGLFKSNIKTQFGNVIELWNSGIREKCVAPKGCDLLDIIKLLNLSLPFINYITCMTLNNFFWTGSQSIYLKVDNKKLEIMIYISEY